jgi:hypothetical protein
VGPDPIGPYTTARPWLRRGVVEARRHVPGFAGAWSKLNELNVLLVAHAGGFASQIAQVEEAGPTHDALADDFDLLDAR